MARNDQGPIRILHIIGDMRLGGGVQAWFMRVAGRGHMLATSNVFWARMVRMTLFTVTPLSIVATSSAWRSGQACPSVLPTAASLLPPFFPSLGSCGVDTKH
jgi:hypothetical protein